MKKKIISIVCLTICFLITGCTASQEEKNAQNLKEEKKMEKKLTLTIDNSQYDVTLYDTPAANALYDMLPLELTFEDFNNIEKIAYLEKNLPIESEPDGFDPNMGDLCFYVPWGNLSIFYKDFSYSDSLVSLGYIDTGINDISHLNDDFSAKLEIKK